jgi:RNA polymerase subunit RPABC4/transcription elongation factor Spt4
MEVRQSGSHLNIRCGSCQTVVPIHGEICPSGRSAQLSVTWNHV